MQPDNARLRFKYAFMAMRSNALKETVLENLNRAIELDPAFAPAYLLRARYRDNVESKTADVLADCKKAISLSPDSISVRLTAADSIMNLSERDPSLMPLVREQIEEVVRLGISKSALIGASVYRQLENEQWLVEQLRQAESGSQQVVSPFSEATSPSLPL